MWPAEESAYLCLEVAHGAVLGSMAEVPEAACSDRLLDGEAYEV